MLVPSNQYRYVASLVSVEIAAVASSWGAPPQWRRR